MFGTKSRRDIKGEEFIERSVRKYPKVIFWIFLFYFLLFASYMIWYFYFISTHTLSSVDGISMQNTLNASAIDSDDCYDWVYVNNNKLPEQFDIITISSAQFNDKGEISHISLIKRAIALEGDFVTIKKATGEGEDGYFHVYIQKAGELAPTRLDEGYIKSYEEWSTMASHTEWHLNNLELVKIEYEQMFYQTFLKGKDENVVKIGDTWYYKVPENSVFYLGDNRAHSSDSRIRGVASLDDLEGVAEIILKDAELATDTQLIWIKTSSICQYYWSEIEDVFAR